MTKSPDFRKQAEKTLKTNRPEALEDLSAKEARRLIHELQVHQIELDLQNEELRTAQTELGAARARYFDLYDLAPVGYVTLSEKGLILEANLTAATMLGVVKGALIKRPLARFILPADQDIWNRYHQSLIETSMPKTSQLRLRREDRAWFWVQLTATPLPEGESKTPVGHHVVLTDITERKQAEEALLSAHDELEGRVVARTAELENAMKALKADEERFRTVADFTNDWESWIGPDGRYIYVSPSCKSVSGYLPWDFYQDPSLLEKIIHPEDLAAWKEAVTKNLESKGAVASDFRIITHSGEERWISFKSQAVYNRDGSFLGRRDSNRDTTDRKRAMETLKESQERFRALVENTNDWVWETDRRGNYVYVSPRSVDLLDYTPEEIIGRSHLDFLHPDKAKETFSRLKNAFEAGEPFRGIEKTCHHKKGNRVIVESSGLPIFDSLGNLMGFRGIDRDITERKDIEALTLRTRHLVAIGELAAGVAHEINNPINGIINYAQILADDAAATGGDTDIPRRIMKEGDRVADIVKNLLFFSRQSSGEKKPVSVRLVIEDSLALFAAQLRKEGLHVGIDIPEDIPPVMANRQQLQQVFVNILANSRHALLGKSARLSDKRRIEIKARVPESNGVEMVTVCFYDNGTGIAPEILDRVFDPFFTTKRLGEGTGLGLSISFGIVKDHGGNMIVESEPDEYTQVSVYLPSSTAG